MKSLLKYIVGLLMVGFLFTSCQKVVVLDLNTVDPRLVIEGNITTKAGEPSRVFLSTSGDFYTGEGLSFVENATVIIRDSLGNETTLEKFSAGIFYTYDIDPVEDMTYSLDVVHEGITYSGDEEFPVKKTVDSIWYVVNEGIFGNGVNEDGDTTYNIFVRFQDPEDTFDYYRMVLSLNDSIVQAGFGVYLVVDDEVFNGQLFDFEIVGSGAIKGDTVQVDFQAIGANTYTYYLGLNDALQSGGLGSTPYNPISNLNNDALGYFGAFTSNLNSIIIE